MREAEEERGMGAGGVKESHCRLLMTVQKKAAVHQWNGEELT